MTLKIWSALSLLVLVGACETLPARASSAEAPVDCWGQSPIPVVDYRHDLIFGELHGTAESPAVIAAYVCQAKAENRRITLALEMTPEALAAGVSGDANDPFWSSNFPDGRSSRAMLELLNSLRPFVLDGTVALVGFDGRYQDWEVEAAASILRQRERGRWLMVYTGNYHARRSAEGTPTLGTLLPHAKTVNIAAQENGTAWFCTPECGVNRVGGMRGAALGLSVADPATGFDFNFVVPQFSASEPATRSGTSQ